MNLMRYFCCDDRRRGVIDGRGDINGIDFLEVLDDPSLPDAERQRTLFVHFINDPAGLSLGPANVRIEGGERDAFRDPPVTGAGIRVDGRSGSARPVLVVTVAHPGDFSTYTLLLVAGRHTPRALDRIDPLLRAVDFSFKAGCPSDFDCREPASRPAGRTPAPAIDYLARDFESFRTLMLDRLAVLLPDWKERNPADLGVALVELLAYVGDYLSYRQDAVATEAYLATARRRVSVRRHARLVDYRMHDGINARAWIQVEVAAGLTLKQGTRFFTAVPEVPPRIAPGSPEEAKARAAGAEVFMSLSDIPLFPSLNRMELYTWGAGECCLPKGATRATLRGRLTDLKPGMVLIFQEVLGPRSGDPDDADPRRRHAVRLVAVAVDDPETGARLQDPIGGRFEDPPSDRPVAVTEIAWAEADALPFPVCVSARTDDGELAAPVSIALGNIVLADHGRPVAAEALGEVPRPMLKRVPHPESRRAPWEGCRAREDMEEVPPRFRPVLKESPLTQAAPYDPARPPASAFEAMRPEVADARPVITLHSRVPGQIAQAWAPRRDLLASGNQADFVVEVEADGRAQLRFGDGVNGARPAPGAAFTADYRVGGGPRGNVGAESLVHVAAADEAVLKVTNPLPAMGGKRMESMEQVRRHAPQAFRAPEKQVRAVTPADYAAAAARHPRVQKAAAQLRWTGSWHTLFVSVDLKGGARLDDASEQELREHLAPCRLAGHDLEIDRPRMVPLELAMEVEVDPAYEQSRVRAALLQVFCSRRREDGRTGLLHPDRFTFGQTVYLSPLYAAAQAVPGVAALEITAFRRQGAPATDGVDEGKLVMGRFEIPCLDNDPNFPDRGVFHLKMRGGR